MIRDINISIGRVGTLAVYHFLQTSPEITPTSWFDLPTIRRHWQALDRSARRYLVMVHHAANRSIIPPAPDTDLRISWNTRCPFASARSSINWRIFQDIILHGGQPPRPWTDLIGADDLCGFYADIVDILEGYDPLILDISELSGNNISGYEKIATHHGLSLKDMAPPSDVQSGDFETFICSYRFIIDGFSYLLVPAKDIIWNHNDKFIGYVDGLEIFPQFYKKKKIMSLYVAMDRPDSQWKHDFCRDLFEGRKADLGDEAQSKYEEYKKIYEQHKIPENSAILDGMVNNAFGNEMSKLVRRVPLFENHWNTSKIASSC